VRKKKRAYKNKGGRWEGKEKIFRQSVGVKLGKTLEEGG